MADLSINFAGIKAPNPFWLASAPPANSGDQVKRAFDAGWGGVCWKTLGEPITNVTSRFAAYDFAGKRMAGFNNIELITDRPLEVNFREIRQVKQQFPEHAVVVSLMVESREDWQDIIKRSEDAGADGLELNFGCPHGMCERGMGSAVGQEPKVLSEIIRWVMEAAHVPVIVKLTPNISDICVPALGAQAGGANAVSLINTIKSLMSVDIDSFSPLPSVAGKSTNGGYCGPAVKPIALHMVAALARHPQFKLPISGIGGISNWRDAVEFILLGASTLQVCTAVMHHGYGIIEDMLEGLNNYMDEKGFTSIDTMVGRAIPNFVEWGELDLNYQLTAIINEQTCIGCEKCYVSCMDGAHQCIHLRTDSIVPRIDETECVGCNLCALVCPVPECITMQPSRKGEPESWNQRLADQANT